MKTPMEKTEKAEVAKIAEQPTAELKPTETTATSTPDVPKITPKRMKTLKYYLTVQYYASGKPYVQLHDDYGFASRLTYDDIYELEIPSKSKEQEEVKKVEYEEKTI